MRAAVQGQGSPERGFVGPSGCSAGRVRPGSKRPVTPLEALLGRSREGGGQGPRGQGSEAMDERFG